MSFNELIPYLPLVISSLSLLLTLILIFRVHKADNSSGISDDLRNLKGDVNNTLFKIMDMTRTSSETLFHEQRRESKEMNESFALLREGMRSEIEELKKSNQASLEGIERRSRELEKEVSGKLEKIMEINFRKLDEMKSAVGENLQESLGKSLSESFSVVSKNLESLHDAIGEMRHLGAEVGDLRKLFGNVKTRGTWGELQLDAILSDMLTPEQYVKNFRPSNTTRDAVEFALRLPGKGDGNVFLPIDSKFPKEDYERYLLASSESDRKGAEDALKMLRARIKDEAGEIKKKYINPPRTTDFAILFVPSESMYAELLRIPGFMDDLIRSEKVIISGPTTMSALISSLEMGFRTLQIEKRSEEVWNLFSKIRHEMNKFSDEIAQTQKALDGAVRKVDQIAKRSGQIGSRLESVALPDSVEIEAEEKEGTSPSQSDLFLI